MQNEVKSSFFFSFCSDNTDEKLTVISPREGGCVLGAEISLSVLLLDKLLFLSKVLLTYLQRAVLLSHRLQMSRDSWEIDFCKVTELLLRLALTDLRS